MNEVVNLNPMSWMITESHEYSDLRIMGLDNVVLLSGINVI